MEKTKKAVPASVATPAKKSYYATESNMALLRACAEGNDAALLIGETGTGKTTIIREVAKEYDKHLIRISVNGSMGIEEILGKWLVEKGTTKWQDGILTSALREGHWVVMDEINAALPEILFVLHSLLDDDRKIILPEKDNELVTPHAEFRFFATMNPPEEYAGTKDMNKALLSRFTAVLWVDVLSQIEEIKLLEEKGADLSTATTLVKAATLLRDRKRKDDIFYFCSTRDLVQCVDLVTRGLSLPDAFTGAVVNKMSRAEHDVVKNELNNVLKVTPITIPAKSLDELISTVAEYDARMEAMQKKLEKDYEAKLKKVREDAVRQASDQVSNEFLEKLKELAAK